MGLKDIAEEASSGSSSNTTRNYGTRKSGRELKKNQKERTPYLVIRRYDDPPEGEDQWQVLRYPMIPTYTYTREDEDSNWQFTSRHEADEKIIWSRDGFRILKDRIERSEGKNLNRLLVDDTEEALRLLKRAGGRKNKSKPETRIKCAVCGERHDGLNGKWARIEHRAICMDHTVRELHEEGILDDL